AKYLFVLLANTLPGSNCLSRLVACAEAVNRRDCQGEITETTKTKETTETTKNPPLLPLVGARPEIRLSDQPLPQGSEGYLSWHDFSGLLVPREFLLEAKSADPNLWTVKAQAVDMCFRAWACGRLLIECP